MKTSISSLQNVHTLSSAAKKALIRSISHEMQAIFMAISIQLRRGNLNTYHTTPIHTVIRAILQTAAALYRRLERRVTRYERRAKRWRAERRWIQEEFAEVVRQSEMVHQRWKTRVQGLESLENASSPSTSSGR